MDTRNILSRRSMLKASSCLIASAAVAPVAAVESEHVTDKIERLSAELSAAIGEYQDGTWSILISRDNNVSLRPTPPKARVDLQAYLDSITPRNRANWHMGRLAEALCDINPGYWSTSNSDIGGDIPYVLIHRDHERSKTLHGIQTNYIL